MMKIFDAHVHTQVGTPVPAECLAKMYSVGISGGSVFSPPPESPIDPNGIPYETRLKTILEWTGDYKDKLFPVLWIHPLEKDAVAKAKDAVASGVNAFKMICDCYYVYDKESMDLLKEIAKLGKPVFFHSGILWNGYVSSKYNRPLNWEALLEVEGLKFSLAHCSWPWYDEAIALYGKFLNTYVNRPELSSEMFFDLTPGTPVSYRRDLLYKLFNSGYDVPHNILFGTDCTANSYNTEWAGRWIKIDNEHYDELGVGQRIRELIYGENYLRFLGIIPKDFTHVGPVPDSANAWTLEKANATL
ncbi:MAG TPA: amidohydrolase family protein [Peptococcaceae bacterium]|nr:amidohydrolase family protein [Peptococcaceae bacterium]